MLVFNPEKKRAIFIDTENEAEILEYVSSSEARKKKFAYIRFHILNGVRNTEIYDKEDINNHCRDVTAMKFFKGGSNDRIYCKEIKTTEGVFVVVASILHEKKKAQKNSKREVEKIETVANYDYVPISPTSSVR